MTTAYSVTACAVIPATLLDKANALACALGYDEMPGNTFSIPLAPNAAAAPTHYAFNTVAMQSFVDDWQAASQGTFPAGTDLAAFGLTTQDASDVVAAMATSFVARVLPDSNATFDALIAAGGLVVVIPAQ